MTTKTQFINNRLKKAKETLSLTQDAISEKVTDLQHNLAKSVKRNPFKTVGYSILAGLLIARLLRPRK